MFWLDEVLEEIQSALKDDGVGIGHPFLECQFTKWLRHILALRFGDDSDEEGDQESKQESKR